MAPITAPSLSTPPNPWMLVRLQRPGEDALMLSLDHHIQHALSSCDRCSNIYMQTGLIPLSCHVCGAERDEMWLACIEDAARKNPQAPLARPAIATNRLILRQIG
jgi:hypothetical protein